MADSATNPRGERKKMTKIKAKSHKDTKSLERQPEAGVIYIAHLPWGFEEHGLRAYFSQFGTVTKLRLARSRKTGNSKGYAFLKFKHDEVAKIAAETMDNYLMFDKLIKCKQIKDVHPATFWGRKGHFKPRLSEAAIREHNKEKSVKQLDKNKIRACKKFSKKSKMLAELGIEYNLSDILKRPVSTSHSKQLEVKSTENGSDDEVDDEQESDTDSDGSADCDSGSGSDDDKLAEVKLPVEMDDEQKSDVDCDGSGDLDSDSSSSSSGERKSPVKVDDEQESDADSNGSEDWDFDSSNDDDDDEGDGKLTEAKSPVKTPLPMRGGKHAAKTPKGSMKTMSLTPKSSGKALLQKTTTKREILKQVKTPKGVQNVLIEDSSDDEVSFKTPPQTVRSSALLKSGSYSTPGAKKRKYAPLKSESKKEKTAKRRYSEGGHFLLSGSRAEEGKFDTQKTMAISLQKKKTGLDKTSNKLVQSDLQVKTPRSGVLEPSRSNEKHCATPKHSAQKKGTASWKKAKMPGSAKMKLK